MNAPENPAPADVTKTRSTANAAPGSDALEVKWLEQIYLPGLAYLRKRLGCREDAEELVLDAALLALKKFDRNHFASSTFSTEHLLDLPSLARKLKHPARAFDTWLAAQLSPASRAALANYQGPRSDPAPLQKGLMEDLNLILQGASIYEHERFAGISLREETRTSMSQNPHGSDLERLNRLLMEAAYPQEILWKEFADRNALFRGILHNKELEYFRKFYRHRRHCRTVVQLDAMEVAMLVAPGDRAGDDNWRVIRDVIIAQPAPLRTVLWCFYYLGMRFKEIVGLPFARRRNLNEVNARVLAHRALSSFAERFPELVQIAEELGYDTSAVAKSQAA